MVTYDDFAKLEIRAGTILNCNAVEGSVKLLKLEVDFGSLGTRTILTGMAPYFKPEEFIGLQTLFLYNLESRKMMGMESQGMLLSVGLDHSKKPILIKLADVAENGDGVN